jgi:hypothetical protein
LEALAAGSQFAAAAFYEPGAVLGVPAANRPHWMSRCQDELAAGKEMAAFTTFVRGINPETTGKAPRALLRLVLPLAIRGQERRDKLALLPVALSEHEAAARIGGGAIRYADIDVPTLFMSGKGREKTEAGRAAEILSATLAKSRLLHYPRLDHFGPERSPVQVATDIIGFFGEVAGHE